MLIAFRYSGRMITRVCLFLVAMILSATSTFAQEVDLDAPIVPM